MAINLKILFILLCSVSVLFTEEASLQFKTGAPAFLKIVNKVASKQKINGEEITTRSKEEIIAALTVVNEKPVAAVLPLLLTYELQDYSQEIEVNGKKFHRAMAEPSTHIMFAGLKELQGKKVLLSLSDLERGFDVISEGASREILEINDSRIKTLLLSHLRNPFFLVDHALSKGSKIETPIETSKELPIKGVLRYVITEVSDAFIKADISYEVDRQRVQGDIGLKNETVKGTLVTSGKLTGKGVWSRLNALNFKLELNGAYSSAFKIEGLEHTVDMEVSLSQDSDSERQEKISQNSL
jgi:hypothetical protein